MLKIYYIFSFLMLNIILGGIYFAMLKKQSFFSVRLSQTLYNFKNFPENEA